jgi:ABC-type uncharacterized transport system ATPase subunit
MDSHAPNKAAELLQLSDIMLNYDHFTALNHLDLVIKRAEVHAIVGEHGPGNRRWGWY